MSRRSAFLLSFAIAPALVFLAGLGCVSVPSSPVSYSYFQRPDPTDAWSGKIAGWQRRERSEELPALEAPPPVAEGKGGEVSHPFDAAEGDALRIEYFSFRARRRRALASEFVDWIQSEAKQHYFEDGPVDHWATLEETLSSDGDDCDGLELLVYHGLRDLGYSESEVYRAIVYRPSDGQHHMVTLWFEDRNDPWVIDPTGAMSEGLHRMSELTDWVPLKVFSVTAEYTVQRSESANESATLASAP